MSAIFDGTARLTTPNHLVGATPDYPVLIVAWAKVNNVTALHGFGGISDNAAIGALDGVYVICAGTVINDPIRTAAYAAGGASAADQNGMTANAWRLVGCVLRSASNRSSILGTTVGTAQTTTRSMTGLSLASIGAFVYNGGATIDFPLAGKEAEYVVASGFSIGNLATILTQLNAGTRAINVAELSGTIDAYQPLRNGLNDAGYVGPPWDNTNVTWDSADHPISYGSPHYYQQQM